MTPKKVCNPASRTEKVKFLMFFDVECFVYISRIVLPTKAGSTFSENSQKKLSDSAKRSRKTIDGKCDGYMGGLGGTKKRKC